MNKQSGGAGRRSGWIAAGAFLAFAALTVVLLLTKRYPSPFDELEHVSYIATLQETRNWRPMFEVMQTLVNQDLLRWDQRPNYLGHPSPFYWFETLFLDRTLPLHEAVVRLRLGSAALAAGGIGLALWAGWRHFQREPLALLVFCGLVALCPKLLATTGQVTNDALAIGAGGLAYWGAGFEARRRTPGIAACAVGLMLAMWAKPNAALAIGAALGAYAVLRLRARPWLIPAMAAGSAAGSVPYWPILAKYGALVPITVEQFGHVHQVPGVAYVPAFLFTVAYTFCLEQTGTWPVIDAASVVAAVLAWLLLAAVVGGGVAALRRSDGGTTRLLAIAGPVAFFAVFPIHFWFSAGKLGGSLPAASFRYYLPIWPFMAHAFSYGMTTMRPPWRFILAWLAGAVLVVGWLSP
jgi:hypothetical protein